MGGREGVVTHFAVTIGRAGYAVIGFLVGVGFVFNLLRLLRELDRKIIA